MKGTTATLRHALDVLLDNALQHGNGEVRVEHTVTADTVIITVSDEGDGFSTSIAETHETDSASPRHGLGLPLARRLIETMPGRLTITPAGPGPRVDIVLQRAEPSPQ